VIQPPLLFSGTSNRELADEIAKKMQTRIGNALVDRFKNDECRVEIRENVRGAEVFILQSLCRTPWGGRAPGQVRSRPSRLAPLHAVSGRSAPRA
jgi:phosphoribosylpyrophosphate synthetase